MFFCIALLCFFFFSSRRRHTRLQGDWSSAVCSSDLAARQGRRAGFSVRVRTQPPAERRASDLETACFRVAQEAITNVARHAGAKRVEVDARAEDGTLDLTVRDDGSGFDVAAVRGGTTAEGSIGLDGMEERVHLLGGDFRIDSQPGTGTTVWARFPLTEP